MALRIIFMGTPEFSIPTLEILMASEHEIVGIVTATDKYGGRGKSKLIESAVKKYAVTQGIPLFQPKNLKDPDFAERLRALKADLQIVVAFRMLPEVVWVMPPLGTMNLHGSLLPRYRGAAPINWAIINGETETGVTTFMLKHAIDTGNILLQETVPIFPDDTAGNVHDRMKEIGAAVVLESVNQVASGSFMTTEQDEAKVSAAPKIYHDMCAVNFDQPTASVYNFIRGLSPLPTAWTTIDGQQVNIYQCRSSDSDYNEAPGLIKTDQKKQFEISTADGSIRILELQIQGRKRMKVADFLNGYQIGSRAVDAPK